MAFARVWTAALFSVAAACASADTLRGKVVRIADGDTITVLDSKNRQHKVRLGGIDAPERKQAYYEAARQNLAKLAFGKMVVVEWHKRDRYGRVVGKVEADRRDVGLVQVRAGLAWWYREYAHEQSAFDRSLYENAELEARVNRRGLWQSAKRTAPWAWRDAQGAR